MRMSALLVVLLLAVAPVAGVAAGTSAGAGVTHPVPTQPATTSVSSSASFVSDTTELSNIDTTSSPAQIDTTNTTPQSESQTTITISVHADQSAFWRIETQYALTNPNETRAFEEIARQYERNNINIGPQITLFRTLQTEATASTDRRMQIRNVSYHANVSDNRGTLALSFRWSNFAQQGQNETLLIGDVFKIATDEADVQRTWMSIVGVNQQIIIHPPNRYTVSRTSIPVQQRESAVVLTQPSDFAGNSGLEIRYSAVEENSIPTALIAGAILGFLGIIGILYGSRRYRTDNGDPDGTEDNNSSSPGSGLPPTATGDVEGEDNFDSSENNPSMPRHADTASSSGVSGDSASPTSEPTSTSVSDSSDSPPSVDGVESAETEPLSSDTPSEMNATTDVDTADSSTTTESTSEMDPQSKSDSMPDISTDPALLSDEERVEQLLSRNGGRMRQASIVDKTGWSDAKVSQVLSMMAEDDRVDKLRLGRENLISLPDGSTTSTQTDDEQMSTD
ncbi:hypothetical protein [Haloquadratum walsbyi]|jgi:hypothetical protein|uniref:Transmembrane glycoprotein / HTH domain protein n=1 Tax=Haloquadratum walsbyi J07HQW2 TaxID=1238425 RepID=U1NEW9_9EURY|nr:hypothetical protein [Haloquadratum walsbyi]ERG95318.1 MAG: hypothetical protein J07HQW2_01772 [Haloquadratum walsbyi J07HQW2]